MFLKINFELKRIVFISMLQWQSQESLHALSLAFVLEKLTSSPDPNSVDFYNLSLLWNMHLNYLCYHSDNIDPAIAVFESLTCTLIVYNLSLCRQPTSRKNWPTSSPSYWTALLRSKASMTLPSYPATPPWSCVNDSAASWPPFAGWQTRGDELGSGVAWLLSLVLHAQWWAHPWTSFNPCLPLNPGVTCF